MCFCYDFQDIKLGDDIASGIIVSNRSLVLQRVTKRAAGLFSCQATNAEGHASSNQLQLNVKCKLYIHISMYIHASFLTFMILHNGADLPHKSDFLLEFWA